MRGSSIVRVLVLAVMLPAPSTAQVSVRPTPDPNVSAANTAWVQRGDPIFYAGSLYYPAGATVFFDGNVMNRIGTYEGVPLYHDATLGPYEVIYVPIGGKLLRPYERKREGGLAGTVGSRTPSFPVQLASEGARSAEPDAYPLAGAPESIGPPPVPPQPPLLARQRGTLPMIQQVWVPFDRARWSIAGPAVPFSADRFVKIGEYHGFPVYREKNNRRATEIYIPTIPDGPVAPYKKISK